MCSGPYFREFAAVDHVSADDRGLSPPARQFVLLDGAADGPSSGRRLLALVRIATDGYL
jgi:hypothetical protein